MLFSLLEMVNLLLILWVFSRDNDNTWGFLVLVLLFKTRNIYLEKFWLFKNCRQIDKNDRLEWPKENIRNMYVVIFSVLKKVSIVDYTLF